MHLQEARDLCIKAHKGQWRRERPTSYEPDEPKWENYINEHGNLMTYVPYRENYWMEQEPYHTHPIGVADMLEDESEKKVAYLHDIIEDTEAELFSDKSKNFYSIIFKGNHYRLTYFEWNALRLLTKVKGQRYDIYLMELAHSSIAINVKIADMIYNLCDNPSDKQKIKYKKGLMYLLSIR